MQKLHLPPGLVKKLFNSRLNVLLAALVVGAAFLPGASPQALYRKANRYFEASASSVISPAPRRGKGCCVEIKDRRMVGTYYNTKDSWESELVLNNKGPAPIDVTPILYSLNGERFAAGPVNVAGQFVAEIDLNELARQAGPQFAEGNYEFTYTGRSLEIGGGIRIVDEARGLIFDEQLSEPGVKFGVRLEAVYAAPYRRGQVKAILTNTTDQTLTVNGSHNRYPIRIQLKAHESRIMELRNTDTGSMSLVHNGAPGALLAIIHIQEPEKSFSTTVTFVDPAKAKSNRIDGAGLKIGEGVKPVIAIRNIGVEKVFVDGRIPFTKVDGTQDKVSLPELALEPGEVKLFDTNNPRLRRKGIAVAGLELEHKGQPGDVIASAFSLSSDGDQVFVLPVKDPEVQPGSNGGYPWFIEDDYWTVIYIKNVTDKRQHFALNVVYPEGIWGSDTKTLAPGETYQLDLWELRDSQTLGSEGNTIPLDAKMGHISWSAVGNSDRKGLIGRSQAIYSHGGMTTSYECNCGCNWDYYDSRLTPDNGHGEPGATQQFTAQQRDMDCMSNPGVFYTVSVPYGIPINFTVGNYSLASITNGDVNKGLLTAEAQGSVYVRAEWTPHTYEVINNNCHAFNASAYPSTFYQVDQIIPHHVKLIADNQGYPPSCATAPNFVYVREMTQQVVNIYNRSVLSGSIEEAFGNSPNNTCGNGNPTPAGCALLGPASQAGVSAGQFRDAMTVINPPCNSSGISWLFECGYTVDSTWRMCSGQTMSVWRYNGETKSNYVKVDGRSSAYTPGTYFYP